MRWFNRLLKRGLLLDTQLAQLACQAAHRCHAVIPREVERKARQMRPFGALGYLRAKVGPLAAAELDGSLKKELPELQLPSSVRDRLFARVLNEMVVQQRKMPYTKLVTRRITGRKRAA